MRECFIRERGCSAIRVELCGSASCSPKKLVIYDGNWDRRYEDAFPAVRAFQNFSFNDEKSLAAFKRALPVSPPEQERFLFMRRLIIEAGTQLMLRYGARSIYGSPRVLDRRKNPALDVDVFIQDQIVSQIRETFPSDDIMAEERKSAWHYRKGSPFVWTVDPLDGTLNYVAGDDRFCCGVGLLHKGKPFMGVFSCPRAWSCLLVELAVKPNAIRWPQALSQF